MTQTIISELDRIEQEREVKVLMAAESGSRAWGCPSPDSDYDARFLYVHRLDHYLTIGSPRDVIEVPISDKLDLNGWDLKKALNLMLKGNRTLADWILSPVRYSWEPVVADNLREICKRSHSQIASKYHYLGLCESSWKKYLRGKDVVRTKKYLYALRPALSLMWMRVDDTMPPMDFPKLRTGLRLTEAVQELIDSLIDDRRNGVRERKGPQLKVLDELIELELTLAREDAPKGEHERINRYALRSEAENFFREVVKRYDTDTAA